MKMSDNTTVQVKTRNSVKTPENVSAEVELSKGTMVAMAVVPAAIGLWSVSCFVGAMVASGGPLQLVKNWFLAVSGM
jgi:hypothetical protein